MAAVTLLLCSCLVTLSPGWVRAADSYRRQVTFEYNPGRNDSTAVAASSPVVPNVLHVRAVGRNDTIHYLWSSLGAPTVLLVYSDSPSSTVHINWTLLELQEPRNAVHIEPRQAVVYSTSLLFSRLLEYDDVNETADLSQAPAHSFYPPYQLQDFTWDNANATINSSTLTAQLRGRNATGRLFDNGSITFRIAAFEDSGRDLHLPRLLHTANSSKLEFVIEGLQPRGNRSRFGLELMVLEQEGFQRQMRVDRTIDDEYTPSIFKVSELLGVSGGRVSSFLQWKPVAYGSPQAVRTNSMQSRHYRLRLDHNQTLPATSIAFAFGAEWRTAALNVSFGSPGEQLYNSHQYISWSVLVGYGEPPEDGLSALVVAAVVVELGVPVLLLLLGGVVVCIVRRRESTGYQPIN